MTQKNIDPEVLANCVVDAVPSKTDDPIKKISPEVSVNCVVDAVPSKTNDLIKKISPEVLVNCAVDAVLGGADESVKKKLTKNIQALQAAGDTDIVSVLEGAVVSGISNLSPTDIRMIMSWIVGALQKNKGSVKYLKTL
jgi:hypothetical protein